MPALSACRLFNAHMYCSETQRERSKQTRPFLLARREYAHAHAYVIDLCTEIYVLPSGECEQDADPIQTAAIWIESRLHSIWISVNRARDLPCGPVHDLD